MRECENATLGDILTNPCFGPFSQQHYAPSHQPLAKRRLQDQEGGLLGHFKRHFGCFGRACSDPVHGQPGSDQAFV